MKKVLFLVMTAFLLIALTDSLWAAEAGKEMNTISSPSEAKDQTREEGMKHEDMKQKEHRHEEGMHGMMMGHHSTGWAIAIGVVMVVMMAAMALIGAKPNGDILYFESEKTFQAFSTK